MADEAAAVTEYRVLKKLETDNAAIAADAINELPEGTELYALLPATFDGNVRAKAHEAAGDGDYAKVAARSFKTFPARAKTVVSFT